MTTSRSGRKKPVAGTRTTVPRRRDELDEWDVGDQVVGGGIGSKDDEREGGGGGGGGAASSE